MAETPEAALTEGDPDWLAEIQAANEVPEATEAEEHWIGFVISRPRRQSLPWSRGRDRDPATCRGRGGRSVGR